MVLAASSQGECFDVMKTTVLYRVENVVIEISARDIATKEKVKRLCNYRATQEGKNNNKENPAHNATMNREENLKWYCEIV